MHMHSTVVKYVHLLDFDFLYRISIKIGEANNWQFAAIKQLVEFKIGKIYLHYQFCCMCHHEVRCEAQ